MYEKEDSNTVGWDVSHAQPVSQRIQHPIHFILEKALGLNRSKQSKQRQRELGLYSGASRLHPAGEPVARR